jgi:hypothetical protein
MTDITIRFPQIGGERVIVEAASYKGTKFLMKFRKHFDLVSFGEGPVALLSVQNHRAVALRAFIRSHGLEVTA